MEKEIKALYKLSEENSKLITRSAILTGKLLRRIENLEKELSKARTDLDVLRAAHGYRP